MPIDPFFFQSCKGIYCASSSDDAVEAQMGDNCNVKQKVIGIRRRVCLHESGVPVWMTRAMFDNE